MKERSLLRAALVRHLHKGEGAERLAFVPSPEADLALSRAIVGTRGKEEIQAALKLIVALRKDLDSPGAARTLRSWLRRSHSAMVVIRALVPKKHNDAVRRLALPSR